jgi:NCK-associated protein 1
VRFKSAYLFQSILRVWSYFIRMVQFVEAYDPPLKGLHDDLNFVSPRIGEVRT